MAYSIITVCLCAFSALCVNAADPIWTYTRVDTGTSTWSTVFPKCGGYKQSPINLQTTFFSTSLYPKFNFHGYEIAPTTMTIENNGHTAQASITATTTPAISGGGLPGRFNFAQFHFHWGADDSRGSEHTVNNNRYPLELHLVHYDSSYADLGTALSAGSYFNPTLAVLGVLFEISDTDNPAFTPLLTSLASIINSGDQATVDPAYPLAAFLPCDRNRFFRYKGSLTTPTCDEVVIWTVFKSTVHISSTQLEEFRQLIDNVGDNMVDNYRPLQRKNFRFVKNAKSHLNCH